MRQLTVLAATGALALGLAAGSASLAIAAGESSGSDTGAPTTAVKKCPAGQVWDPNAKVMFFMKGKCVDATTVKEKPEEKQGLIYDYGRALAKAGHYEEAIAALRLAPDQADPRLLNYLGYSHRKLGRMDEALGYYQAAIARDPDFSLVREYLGEAYIQLGLLEKAREQLSEIERICGAKTCEEYGQLARLIVDSQ